MMTGFEWYTKRLGGQCSWKRWSRWCRGGNCLGWWSPLSQVRETGDGRKNWKSCCRFISAAVVQSGGPGGGRGFVRRGEPCASLRGLELRTPAEVPVMREAGVVTFRMRSEPSGGIRPILGYYETLHRNQVRVVGSSDGSTISRKRVAAQIHAHSFHDHKRANPRIGTAEMHQRERGILALVRRA